MANRVPLIINTTANQIQELAVGDCLDLTASGISNAGVITATKFVGDGSLLTNIGGGSAALQDLVDDITPQLGGNLDINGKILNGSGSIVITGGIQATSFTGSVVGDVTGNVSGSAGSASGLTGNPAIQVASVVATGHIQADTVSVASTLTYEDVTNIDSVGVVTARTGIKVLAGGINAVGVTTSTSFDGALDATDLLSGTIPDARFPATLPAISGENLTNIGGGISDIVDDTTPQLGGDLDLNGKSILGTANIKVDVASGPAVQVMLSNNATTGNGTTPDVSVLGFASGGAVKASIRAAVYGEGWMSFHNNNDSEKMRLTAGGALGIGTDVISGKLDVYGAIYAQDRPNNSGAQLSADGALEIWRDNSDAYIDFKTGVGEDFDCRIQQANNGLNFVTGGNGNATQVSLEVLSGGDVKASSGSVYDSKGELRSLPRNEPSGAYTAATSDKGKFISSGSDVTFDNSATWNTGDAITIFNYNASSTIQIISGTGVLIHFTDGSTASTGTRVLAAKGVCTLLCVEGNNNTFVISGALT